MGSQSFRYAELVSLCLLASVLAKSSSQTHSTRPLHCIPASNVLSSVNSCHISGSGDLCDSVSVVSRSSRESPILIDTTEHDPTPFFPWTHAPICYHSDSSPSSPSHLELCVYTNASFASGRGISIFTTPALARSFSLLPAFTDPSSIAHANEGHSSPGYVTTLPGRGKGLLASRDLKRGEAITVNTPLLLVYREDVLETPVRERYLRQAVEQLPEWSRRRYEDMAVIYGFESIRTQDVLKANIFGLQVGGLEHLAVWPEAARCNHACGPNAQYRMEPDTLIHYVHAARDITKDEEITLTYTNPFSTYTERNQALLSAFHFNCSCSRCGTSSDSDMALSKISKLEKLLSEWSPAPSSRIPTISDAEALIDQYKEEGLDGFLDIPYGHAALMYSAAGDEEGVMKYARLAKEAVGLKEGEGKGDWAFWGRMEKDPTKHWSWERRKV